MKKDDTEQQMDYAKDVAVDPDNLDQEWVNHAATFMRYAEESAARARAVDYVKERLAVLEARLDKAIRERPSKYGLDKVTDKAIERTIALDPEHQAMMKKLSNAKFKAELLNAAVRAMYIKKDALENLVRLHGQNYYSDPTPDSDTPQAFRDGVHKVRRNKAAKAVRSRRA